MKTVPHNDDAEKALLGAMLMNEEAFDNVTQIVRASDFYHPANGVIFSAISTLKQNSGFAVDMITLTDYLMKNGLVEQAGGMGYVSQLTETSSIFANAESYAKIVKEDSIRRSMLALTAQVSEEAGDPKEDVYTILDRTETQLMDLSRNSSIDSSSFRIDSTVYEIIDRIQRKIDGSYKDNTVETGFIYLDKYTNGGFRPEDYIIIAARPSIGKSAFAISLCRNMIANGMRIAFFSLEMPARDVTTRLLSMISRVDQTKIVNANFSGNELERVMNAADNLFSKELYIVDVPNISLGDLRAKARSLKREHDIQCLFIDYIGLVDPGLDQRTPRHEVIATVSKSLKQLARELKIPVVTLCQVSRDSEEKTPILSNLRDSGSIEQDADIVMFLHRKRTLSDEELEMNAKDSEGRATLQTTKVIIAKHRNGQTADFKVGFNKSTTAFENVDSSAVFFEPTPPEKRKS